MHCPHSADWIIIILIVRFTSQANWRQMTSLSFVALPFISVPVLKHVYLFTDIYIAHFPQFNAQMRCTGYEMARYKGTQAIHLYEKLMHTLRTITYSNRSWPKPQLS